MTASARVLAQAKVNLLLRVLAREASGYHSIETVFLRLDLGDRVHVRTKASGRSVDCAGPNTKAIRSVFTSILCACATTVL